MSRTYEFQVEEIIIHTYHVTSDVDANSAAIALGKFLMKNPTGTSSQLKSIEYKGRAEETDKDIYCQFEVH